MFTVLEIMGSVGVYLRVSRELLEKFSRVAESLGLSRSEAIRLAMREFIASREGMSVTAKMRGLVKSRFSLRELEEVYLVSK